MKATKIGAAAKEIVRRRGIELIGYRDLVAKNGSKIVLLVMDGLGGLAQEPGDPTELEAARTPNMDALTGRVVYRRAHRITLATLVQFYRDLRAAYPEAERIYVVQDNWPVHFHPDVLAALEPQQCPWPYYRPKHWSPEPSPTARRLHLPIQLVPLPTYASWANPIEKLWRWLKHDVLHLHRDADQWSELQSRVGRFLDQFGNGSPALLRYVGLQDLTKSYHKLFPTVT